VGLSVVTTAGQQMKASPSLVFGQHAEKVAECTDGDGQR